MKFYDRISMQYCDKCVEHTTSSRVPREQSFTSWVCLLHTWGTRAVIINGARSDWFELFSGLPQGSPLSCLLSALVEQSKATLMRLTAEQWSDLQAKYPEISELHALQRVVGIKLPSGENSDARTICTHS